MNTIAQGLLLPLRKGMSNLSIKYIYIYIYINKKIKKKINLITIPIMT